MARAPTTLDPFNAVAEPKRRLVLETLAQGEKSVNDIVGMLGWPQPMISKHLGVLKDVGLVHVRREGRQRFYKVDGEQLKAIYDWAKTFEKFWDQQLLRVKERAERLARERASAPSRD